MISIGDLEKVELKIGKVLSVEDIPGKDKIYKLIVDIGTEKRQIVSGIRQDYPKEQLLGKTLIIVANLEPKKFAGLESQGMLLAVKNKKGGYSVVTVEDEVEAGTRVE